MFCSVEEFRNAYRCDSYAEKLEMALGERDATEEVEETKQPEIVYSNGNEDIT